MSNIIESYLARSKTIEGEGGKGTIRVARTELLQLADEIGDPVLPDALTAKNQLIQIEQHTGPATSGTMNFTLTRVSDGTEMTTANLSYDASSGNIAYALVSRLEDTYGGSWAFDITGLYGLLTNNLAQFRFSQRAAEEEWIIAINDIDLSPGTVGAVSNIQVGQPNRAVWALLALGGVIAPNQFPVAGAATGWSCVPNPENRGPLRLTNDTVRLLARDAAIREGNPAIYTNLLADLNITP
jgi:hypothetical protein